MFSYSNDHFVYAFLLLLSICNTVAFASSSLPHVQDPNLVVDEVNRYVNYKYDNLKFDITMWLLICKNKM